MANKKINQLVSKTSILGTDLFPLGDGTTGQLFKKTVAELQAAIGGAVISVNGLVGTVVLDTDDIQELGSPTNRYFTDARARGAISLTVTGASGASTYNSSTGVLNVPTYTLAGLGGITASFLSGASGISYNSSTGVISYSGTVYNDASVRALFSGSTGISYNSATGAFSSTITQYTDALARAAISGTTPITYNSTTGAIGITQANTSTNGFLTFTDWNTFNGKQSALTNPVTGIGTTNTLTKFTGASAIGNSNITDTGTLITLGSQTNISSGGLQIGPNTLGNITIRIGKNITGSTLLAAVQSDGAVQSDVTSEATSFKSGTRTAAASFTLANFNHFQADQISIGAGSIITNQYGFFAASSLTGATNNFGFRGAIASGTGRWNIYMDGTANNYMAGSLGIGSTSLTGINLAVSKNITGSTSSTGIGNLGIVQSDVTTTARYFFTQASTQAAAFSITDLQHFQASQGSFGAGSVVQNQYGFFVGGSLTGATNNFSYYGNMPSGTGRWNLYMNGTANNYLAGSLGIGTTAPVALLDVTGNDANRVVLRVANNNVTNGDKEINIFVGGTSAFGITAWQNSGVIESVAGLSSNFVLSNFQNGSIIFANSGRIERMRIASNGTLVVGSSYNAGYSADYKIQLGTESGNNGLLIRASTTGIGKIGFDAGTNGNGLGRIWYDYSSNSMQFYTSSNGTNSLESFRLTLSGNMLIGTTSDNGEKLYVSGAIRATGTITANSDITLKKNLAKIENALEKVEQINGYTYEFKADDSKRHAGVIAQEIQGVLPEIVNKGNDGILGVEYGNISALLIEAIKEQQTQINELKALLNK